MTLETVVEEDVILTMLSVARWCVNGKMQKWYQPQRTSIIFSTLTFLATHVCLHNLGYRGLLEQLIEAKHLTVLSVKIVSFALMEYVSRCPSMPTKHCVTRLSNARDMGFAIISITATATLATPLRAVTPCRPRPEGASTTGCGLP